MDTAELEFGPVSMDFLDRVEELESQGSLPSFNPTTHVKR